MSGLKRMYGVSAEDELNMTTEFPEFSAAAKAMEKAGEKIQLASLPLQKSVAECTVRCFKGVRDAWELSASQGAEIAKCMEQCEGPVSRLEGVLENERNDLLKGAIDCMSQCSEGDNSCYQRCVRDHMSQVKVEAMVSRVISRMKSLVFE